LIIGPRGATITQLQKLSGATLKLRGRGSSKDGDGRSKSGDPEEDNDELHITIEGTDEAIQKAEEEVNKILYDPESASKLKSVQLMNLAELNGTAVYPVAMPMFSHGIISSNPGSYESTMEIKVHNNLIGSIIGKGGENIQRMQAMTGGHVQVSKEQDMSVTDNMRTVFLKGSHEGVLHLKAKIDEIIQTASHYSAPTPTSIIPSRGAGGGGSDIESCAYILKVAIPNDKVGIIIGKGGSTIKGIKDRSRAKVLIPVAPDDDNPQVRTLTIGADHKEAVDAAQSEIFFALQTLEQHQDGVVIPNSITMPILDDKIGVIIGKAGVVMREIQVIKFFVCLLPVFFSELQFCSATIFMFLTNTG